MIRNRNRLTRYDYNWRPDVDDDNDYVWRNGYWWTDDEYDLHMNTDEDALEEYEERRRQCIAIRNEY